jgi:hypothetical protein
MKTFILYVLPTIFLFSHILMGLCDVGPIGIIFKALNDITFQKTYSSFKRHDFSENKFNCEN